jgi:exopolysaccharide biosynthesis polyprenyl glycosylphosphotransferase
MLKEHVRLVQASTYTADIAVTIASFLAAYVIRGSYLKPYMQGLHPFAAYYWVLITIIVVWSCLFVYFRTYKSLRTVQIQSDIKTILKVVFLGGLIIGGIAFVFKMDYLSRGFILIFLAINFVALCAERAAIRFVNNLVRSKGYNYRNIIIVGTNELAINFLNTLEKYGSWGLRMKGFVADDSSKIKGSFSGYPIIGNIDDIEDIVSKNVVDEVIFALPRQRFGDMEDTLLMLEECGVNARMVLDVFPNITAKIRIDEFGNIPLLTFSTIPGDPFVLAVKRGIDIVGSMVLLIMALPIMLLTVLGIKTTSHGSVFYSQQRCGQNGRLFTLYKFRSMIVDAESKLDELKKLNEMKGPVFKMTNDPRTTSLGRFIRKMSIDELPQLWNVLRGDMSLVGPRPALPDEIARYERWQRRRLSMKPGLTCLWQVGGRSKVTDFDEWVRLDLEYIDRWSLKLDIEIFFKTIPVVLFGRGAV